MKNYKVVTIAVQLKNQHIAKYGEVVSEEQLSGNSIDLVKGGFVVEIANSEEPTKSGYGLEEMTKKELLIFAVDNSFTVENDKANKDVIIEELEAQINAIKVK